MYTLIKNYKERGIHIIKFRCVLTLGDGVVVQCFMIGFRYRLGDVLFLDIDVDLFHVYSFCT